MAQEDVKIFFKVDGLEDYITDLDDLKVALGNVDAETQAATKATQKLEQATADALAEEDRRLNVLEGGVKVLAGSAEFAAGAFGLLGDESNEFFEATERNVLQVIALAQGAIDLTEGFRLLKENLQLAKDAQKAFNLIAKANPYVVLAGALIAAAGAFLLFKTRAAEAQKQVEAAQKAFEQLTQDTRESAEADIAAIEEKERLAEITETVGELSRKELKDKIALQKAEQEAAEEQIRLKKEELQAALDANEIIGAGFKSIGFVEKAQKDLDAAQAAYNTTLATTNTELAIYNGELDKRIEKEGKVTNEDNTGTLDRIEAKTVEVIETEERRTGLILPRTELSDEETKNLQANLDLQLAAEEQLAAAKENILYAGVDLATSLAGDNQKVQDIIFAGTKALEVAKIITQATSDAAGVAVSIAKNAAIATAQGFAGDPSGFPRAAAIKAAGAASIATIKLSSAAAVAGIAASAIGRFSGGSAPSIPGGINAGGGGGAAGAIEFTPGLQQQDANVTGVGQNGNGTPVRTYVLAGDVTSAQEADAAIQNLATL